MITLKENGYIRSFQSEGPDDNEYAEAIKIMTKKPEAPEGYIYRLREDLTWELTEKPVYNELPNEEEI